MARALRPGGHFYFDVNNRRAFEKVRPSTWLHDGGDFVMVMHGGYDRIRAGDATPSFGADPYLHKGCRTLYLARKMRA